MAIQVLQIFEKCAILLTVDIYLITTNYLHPCLSLLKTRLVPLSLSLLIPAVSTILWFGLEFGCSEATWKTCVFLSGFPIAFCCDGSPPLVIYKA